MIASAMLSWLIALPLLGIVTGMRAMTPMAVLCWFAYTGRLSVGDTWAGWTGHLATAVIFTLAALGEYLGDKLPKTPNRTAPVGLIARLVLGGLLGAIVATGLSGSGIEGVILGVGGALVGTFGSFLIRKELVQRTGCPDWPIAVAEDLSAILVAIAAMAIVTAQ